LLLHCQQNVPFYQAIFARVGFDAEAVEDLSCLSRLPVLSKEQVSKEFDRLLARNVQPSQLIQEYTGGTSSGTPLRFYKDPEAASWTRALVYRGYEWYGIGLRDRICTVTGWAGKELGSRGAWRRRIRERLQRSMRVYVEPDASDDRLYAIVQRIASFRPSLLYGYPSRLLELGRIARRHGVRIPGLKALQYSSEILFEPERQRLEQWWGCPVYGPYGSTECYISTECPEERRHHLAAETAIVELLDDEDRPAEPGQPGRVVVTPLFARAMPFIRYDLGDLALCVADEPCPCGRTLPSIGPVLGRAEQVLRRADGRPVFPREIGNAFTSCDGVRDFRVYVRDAQKMDIGVCIVLDGSADRAACERMLRQRTADLFGAKAPVTLRWVDRLPPTQGHKRRIVEFAGTTTAGEPSLADESSGGKR